MNREIRIAFIGNHNLYIEALMAAIGTSESIRFAGNFDSLSEASKLLAKDPPSVVVFDIGNFGHNKMKILNEIFSLSKSVKVLAIINNCDENEIIEFFESGISGYLTKDQRTSDLVKAIQCIHKGEIWAGRCIIAKIMNGYRRDRDSNDIEDCAQLDCLTSRENEILGCLKKGLSNREIANNLYISEKTVKTHLKNIFRKLNITKRTEAILISTRNLLLTN